jgi:predicted  nucleic acid-binding Zn-ribbon protein
MAVDGLRSEVAEMERRRADLAYQIAQAEDRLHAGRQELAQLGARLAQQRQALEGSGTGSDAPPSGPPRQ